MNGLIWLCRVVLCLQQARVNLATENWLASSRNVIPFTDVG